jgi:DNA-binding NtrC family response regulator
MPKARILIVDDEPIVCERLGAEMERLGLEVVTCLDSGDALERLSRDPFDVVVTDIKMRGATGIDIVHYIRDECPGTKVIVITGFATVETARAALKGGAVDFIPKPFRMRQLRDLVEKIITEKGAGAPGAPDA